MKNHSIEENFTKYTRKKYFWIIVFLLVSIVSLLSMIYLFFIRNNISHSLFVVSILGFIITIIQLIRYEPKRYFHIFSDKDKLMKSFELGKVYAIDIKGEKKGKEKLLKDILYQEIVHVNDVFLNDLYKHYDNLSLTKGNKYLKNFIADTALFYKRNVLSFCFSPKEYITFVNVFEKTYSHLLTLGLEEKENEEIMASYSEFLEDFKLEVSTKKTLVQVFGNNWHNIILIIIAIVVTLGIIDITFELGLKLDRYLAVSATIPTIYLLKNYNPFKKVTFK